MCLLFVLFTCSHFTLSCPLLFYFVKVALLGILMKLLLPVSLSHKVSACIQLTCNPFVTILSFARSFLVVSCGFPWFLSF